MDRHDLILGTAGHIDHGKTSLIRALTGVETDRLPEEKKRGITIDLGFARLDLPGLRFGVVDVPGHERFVRNMLAGATGMDAVLLVVAADDSVKQQTREHFDILRLLDLPAGVIALTKTDLADPTWTDLVEEEVRDLVKGSFLEDQPIIRTSVQTGEGLEQLREALQTAGQLAYEKRAQNRQTPFRMPIDRVFTISGHGTVVTGSIASGRVEVGEEMQLQPSGKPVRIRGLQSHDEEASQAQRGQRAAINLGGVHHDEIERGEELVAVGSLIPSRLMTVKIQAVANLLRPLKNRLAVRLHVGTIDMPATLRLLDVETLGAGEQAWAQLHLSQEVVASWNQPYIVRAESPVETIGGGRIIEPDAARLKSPSHEDLQALQLLERGSPDQRLEAFLELRGFRKWSSERLFQCVGAEFSDEVFVELEQAGKIQSLAISPQVTLRFHHRWLERVAGQLQAALGRLHDAQPLQLVFPRSEIDRRFDYLPDRKVISAALQVLKDRKTLRATQRGIGLSERGPRLSQNEVKLLAELIRQVTQAGRTPPLAKELEAATARNKESVRSLLELAAGQGDLVELTKDLYLGADVFEDAWQEIVKAMPAAGMTVSEIRELLGVSRKYALPLCEYLDASGRTVRAGDFRVLGDAAMAAEREKTRG